MGYQIAIQAPGSGLPTASGESVSTNTYNATGLLENTSYEFYVQTDCGDGLLSSWVGPLEFYMGYCESLPTSNDGQGYIKCSFSIINI